MERTLSRSQLFSSVVAAGLASNLSPWKSPAAEEKEIRMEGRGLVCASHAEVLPRKTLLQAEDSEGGAFVGSLLPSQSALRLP